MKEKRVMTLILLSFPFLTLYPFVFSYYKKILVVKVFHISFFFLLFYIMFEEGCFDYEIKLNRYLLFWLFIIYSSCWFSNHFYCYSFVSILTVWGRMLGNWLASRLAIGHPFAAFSAIVICNCSSFFVSYVPSGCAFYGGCCLSDGASYP